jgi:YD repeat-containing protein
MKKFYAILCLAIASLTQLQAQAPQGFNYQATVRNSSGDLIVNTNVYFKFNVIQGSQTAVPIFTETHYVPTDDLGQVNLVIGEGTANTGVFSELDWSLGSYYLGIELNTGSGYVAMGTTQLLSVPYAMYAESSGSSSSGFPSGGTEGQVLSIIDGVPTWTNSSSGFPTGGTEGQVLSIVNGVPTWTDVSGSNNPSDGPLVLSIVSTDSGDSNYVSTDTYTYDENKLESLTKSNNQSSTIYTYYYVYTNDKVVRIDGYTSYNSEDPAQTEQINYSYDSQGRLTSILETNSEIRTTTVSYNSNGTITRTSGIESDNGTLEITDIITYQINNNGNIDNLELSGDGGDYTFNFEFDTNNSPFKNVVGLNLEILLFSGITSSQFLSLNNNCISYETVNTPAPIGYNYYYDYNLDGYPRQIIVQSSEEGNESTIAIQYSN